jgi:uncharacterized protein
MDVVVTGSSGLIGSALVDVLRDGGHRPIRLVRGENDAASRDGDVLRWDPSTGSIEADGFEGVDAVVHLAGENIGARRWSEEQKRRIRDSRVHGTSLIAETLAARQRPPKTLVTASGINYYGDRGATPLTEAEPPANTFLADVVVAWEAAADPARHAGIRVAHARNAMVLSEDSGALQRMLPLFKLGLGGRFGRGDQYWSWITLDDEIRALLWLLGHDLAGPVNFASPGAVTNAEFTKALAEVLHRPAFLPVPSFGPKLVVGSELADELLFTSANVVPQALTDSGFRFEHTTIGPALRAVLGR